jgi:hypothetical protein
MDYAKKQRELINCEAFRASHPDAPEGIACVQERPDFVVKTQAGRIGVEVTRCFRPTPSDRRPLQEQFSLQHQIAQRAQKEFEGLSAQKLNVKVVFSAGVEIDKSHVLPTATRLANAVRAIEMTNTLTRHDLLTRDRNAKSVASVHARNSLPGEPSLWLPATAAWVRRLEPHDIQQEILRKQASLGAYDTDVVEVWLLIVADGLAFLELSEAAKECVYEGAFVRVFFLDAFSRRCNRFEVRRADLGATVSPASPNTR